MSNLKTFYVSEKQISSFKNDLNNGVRSFKRFLSLHPELSQEEGFKFYLQEQYDLMHKLLGRPPIRANSYRLLAVEELLENKSEFTKLYNEIMDEIKSGKIDINDPQLVYYNLDLGVCKRSHLIDTIRIEETLRNDFLASMGGTEEAFRKKYTPQIIKKAQAIMTKEQRDHLNYVTQNHFGRIQIDVGRGQKELEERVRPTLINNLLDIYEKFKELGFIDDYISNQNQKLPNSIRITSNDIDEFFTQNSLEKLTTTELLALNAFYFNRLTKELKGLEVLNFISSRPNITIEDLTSSNLASDCIPDSQSAALVQEFEFLNEVHDDASARNYAKYLASDEEEPTDSSYGLTKFDMSIDEFFKDDYPTYQKLTGKSYSEYADEITKMHTLRNIVSNFYSQKQHILSAAILYMSSNKKIQNWGIVPDSKNKINLNKDYLLLGFDIPGFNMPLFLHTPKDTVTDFCNSCMKTDYFPVYEGAEDFTLQGKHLPTPLLIKAPKTLKESIDITLGKLKNGEFINSYEKLYKHIHYLVNPKKASLPDHLRTPIKEKGKEKLKFIRRFVSLTNGTIYDEKELKTQSQK